MTDTRLAAARALLAVEQGRTTLAAEVEAARSGIEDPRDRGLLLELTSGTLRWRNALDAVIEMASRRTVENIDPPVRAVLRLGAYQLRHLDRVPAHAVVHESVDVVRALGAPRGAGFVNAVLRTMARRPAAFSLPPRPSAAGRGAAQEAARLAYLSVTLSHPAWLVARWLTRYGFDVTEKWCQFNNTAPEITVRPIGGLTVDEAIVQLRSAGIEAVPAPYALDALRLAPGALGRVPEDRRRLLIQDEGSQLVAQMVGARPGERVLDVCAAPGGKTVVLATAMGASLPSPSLLIAADRRPHRISLLEATLRRAEVPARVVVLDALRPLPFSDVFDRVLLDAPCSGLGTLRRDPDLKWTRLEADVPRLAGDAGRMLVNAASAVRPGGQLVYATCSSEPEENTGVVDAFLTQSLGFRLAPQDGSPAPVSAGLLDERGCLATRPGRQDLDAFFAAVLVRQRNA